MEFTREGIYDLLGSYPISVLCKKFGLSDNGLKKYLARLDIPTPPPGYWVKIAAGKKAERPPLPNIENHSEILKELREKYQRTTQYDVHHLLKSGTNAKEIREIISSLPERLLQVPEVFVPIRPLVFNTIEYYRNVKNDYDRDNVFSNKNINRLNVSISDKQLRRALNIFQTVIQVMEYLGFAIRVSDGRSYFDIVRAEVSVRMAEIQTRIKKTEGKDLINELVPSGRLKFETYGKFSFENIKIEDTALVKLEEKIADIVTKILYCQVRKIEEKEDLEAYHQKSEEEKAEKEQEEQRQQLRKQLRENERKHLSDIIRGANRLHLANLLREYLSDLEQHYSENEEIADHQRKEAEWLRKKIDWLDPWTDAEDDILLDEDISVLLEDLFKVCQPAQKESRLYSYSSDCPSRGWYPGKKWYMD